MKEQTKKNINNKGWIGRYSKVLILAILILSASAYYIYINSDKMGLAKPMLVITATTGLTSTGGPAITNATFQQSGVAFFYKTTDSPAEFPEIDANVRINKMASAPASYWTSVPYKGEGVYDIKIFFREDQYPKKGDILIIPIRILSRTGAVAYKTTAFWVWE